MSEQIKIPRILQDHEGPTYKDKAKERLNDFRKRVSEKMGRAVADVTFDKSSVDIAEYDEYNPDKLFQDTAFATYEQNLRENHYREQREEHEYYLDRAKLISKKMGAAALMVPGIDLIGKKLNSRKVNKQLQTKRRQAYKQRNGTLKSNLRKQYIDYHDKFDKSTASLKEHRKMLDDRKRQRKNDQ